MNVSAITVRYAKALYQVGEEAGEIDKLKEDIDTLLAVLKDTPEFSILLNSPVIKTSDKRKIFSDTFSSILSPLTINFFNLLAKNKRDSYLPIICLNFLKTYKQVKGIHEATITTAQAMDNNYREEIKQILTKKFKFNIELTEKVNPDLIGGFKLRLDDQQVDASISTQLKDIRNELINA